MILSQCRCLYIISYHPEFTIILRFQDIARYHPIETTSMAFSDTMLKVPQESEKELEASKDLSTSVSSASSLQELSIPPPPYQQSPSGHGFRNPIPELPFTPSTIFTVQAEGTRFWRFPSPSRELEIGVFNGTDTSAEPIYVSTRANRSSGNAILSHHIKGDMYATTYRFGPFREPEIRYLDASPDSKLIQDDDLGKLAFKISTGGCVTSRAVTLKNPEDDSRALAWDYKKTMTSSGKRKVLVLSMKDSSKKDKILAALVRTDDTRTPGTTKSDAGNGGLLLLDSDALNYMDEGLIVATCLMVLKKEIDRQRMTQIALLSAMASGGGG